MISLVEIDPDHIPFKKFASLTGDYAFVDFFLIIYGLEFLGISG